MIVVSYCTKGYAEIAKPLIASLERLGIEHDVELVKLRGSWCANCYYKPQFILRKLTEHKQPVLWVDAYAMFHKKPTVLYNKKIMGVVDVGLHLLPTGEIMAGTLYFGDTVAAKALLRAWMARNEAIGEDASGVADQRGLQELFYSPEHLYQGPAPTIFKMPACYAKMYDYGYYRDVTPVIEHFQASRQTRRPGYEWHGKWRKKARRARGTG